MVYHMLVTNVNDRDDANLLQVLWDLPTDNRSANRQAYQIPYPITAEIFAQHVPD